MRNKPLQIARVERRLVNMKQFDLDQVYGRVDFAVVWASRFLIRMGHFYAAKLLRDYELVWQGAPGELPEAGKFNIVLPETDMTYSAYLPGDIEFYDSEWAVNLATEVSGAQIAEAALLAVPFRLKAGVRPEMLDRRSA